VLTALDDQLQADRDRYLNFYNRERCHQGYRTKGRTPIKPSWLAALRAPLRGPSPELSSTGRNRADCLRFFR